MNDINKDELLDLTKWQRFFLWSYIHLQLMVL